MPWSPSSPKPGHLSTFQPATQSEGDSHRHVRHQSSTSESISPEQQVEFLLKLVEEQRLLIMKLRGDISRTFAIPPLTELGLSSPVELGLSPSYAAIFSPKRAVPDAPEMGLRSSSPPTSVVAAPAATATMLLLSIINRKPTISELSNLIIVPYLLNIKVVCYGNISLTSNTLFILTVKICLPDDINGSIPTWHIAKSYSQLNALENSCKSFLILNPNISCNLSRLADASFFTNPSNLIEIPEAQKNALVTFLNSLVFIFRELPADPFASDLIAFIASDFVDTIPNASNSVSDLSALSASAMASTEIGTLLASPKSCQKTLQVSWVQSFFKKSQDLRATQKISAKPISKIFGKTLAEAVALTRIFDNMEVPAILFRCIEYLNASNAYLEEGIYRLSGSSTQVTSLKTKFDSYSDFDLLNTSEKIDINIVASLLKLYLRELPEPIYTNALRDRISAVSDIVDPEAALIHVKELVSKLPKQNFDTIRLLTSHLFEIVTHYETNKMNVRNIAIVFSPTLQIPIPAFIVLVNKTHEIFNDPEMENSSEKVAPKSLPGLLEPSVLKPRPSFINRTTSFSTSKSCDSKSSSNLKVSDLKIMFQSPDTRRSSKIVNQGLKINSANSDQMPTSAQTSPVNYESNTCFAKKTSNAHTIVSPQTCVVPPRDSSLPVACNSLEESVTRSEPDTRTNSAKERLERLLQVDEVTLSQEVEKLKLDEMEILRKMLYERVESP